MQGVKTFVLLLVLLFGPFISLGKYVPETGEREAWRDDAEVTDDSRLMEDEGEEEEEDEYDRDEREEEERDFYRDEDREDEQEERNARREEVVQIPEQSSEEPREADAADDDDDGEDNLREKFDEEDEVDDLQDDRMMDQDEGGMLLFGQTEKDSPDQTGFEGFKRKVEEINKANEEMQAEINKLKVEFDKALSSDSNNGAPDILADTQHVTSSSVIKAREDTAEDTKSTGPQQRTYDDAGLIRQHSEMGEDANLAPDEDY